MRFHWFYVSLLTIAGVGASGAAEFDVRTFRAWPGYAVSSGSWLAGDLNSDGRGDMVHLVGGADYVHTWTSDGSGGFSVGAFRPWPGYAISNGSWVTGDLDNDRRADMVHLVGGADYVHTWRSRGDGTFNVGAFRPWVGYAISSGSWVLEIWTMTGTRTWFILSAARTTYTLGVRVAMAHSTSALSAPGPGMPSRTAGG